MPNSCRQEGGESNRPYRLTFQLGHPENLDRFEKSPLGRLDCFRRCHGKLFQGMELCPLDFSFEHGARDIKAAFFDASSLA
jgi:hypothetical protein